MRPKHLVILILFSLLITSTLSAQTEVEGEVSGTWELDGSPFVLIDTVIVPEEELEIEPGVEVMFEEDMVLQVNGTLTALGTEDDTIRFKGSSVDNGGSIEIFSQVDSLVFEYCRFDSLRHAIAS